MDYLLVLGDALSDLGLAGADHLVHLAAVLEEEEGGHGAHGKLSGEIADLVHVDLEEHHVGVLLAHLLDGGRDALARAAPRGKEVHHDLQVCCNITKRLERCSSSYKQRNSNHTSLLPALASSVLNSSLLVTCLTILIEVVVCVRLISLDLLLCSICIARCAPRIYALDQQSPQLAVWWWPSRQELRREGEAEGIELELFSFRGKIEEAETRR